MSKDNPILELLEGEPWSIFGLVIEGPKRKAWLAGGLGLALLLGIVMIVPSFLPKGGGQEAPPSTPETEAHRERLRVIRADTEALKALPDDQLAAEIVKRGKAKAVAVKAGDGAAMDEAMGALERAEEVQRTRTTGAKLPG